MDVLKNRLDKIVERVCEDFKRVARGNSGDGDSLLLHFFREKFIHFLLYKRLRAELSGDQWTILPEGKAEYKGPPDGKNRKLGNHDILVISKDGSTKVAFEIFLGYENQTEHQTRLINSNNFETHLKKDCSKLVNGDLTLGYVMNFFYIGCIRERAGEKRSKRKLDQVDDTLKKCVEVIETSRKKSKKNIEFRSCVQYRENPGPDCLTIAPVTET